MSLPAAPVLVSLFLSSAGPAEPSEPPPAAKSIARPGEDVQPSGSPSNESVPADPAQPSEDAPSAAQPDAETPSEATPSVEPAPTTDPSTPEEGAPRPAEIETTEPAEQPEATEPDPGPESGEVLRVSEGSRHDGPPYWDATDQAQLRRRYELDADPDPPRPPVKWRCLIADPTCAINFELNATAAYAHRFRQGDVRQKNLEKWASGRAQYDFWINLPVMVETEGRARYTRMTLGPKGGVIFSDTGDLWGNAGVAMRYWFGRGRWAPAIEVTSALTYKIGSRATKNLAGAEPQFEMSRGPVGFAADVGFGLGGFGAIIVGGQYDSGLAREEVPEQFRTSVGGMFFVGFRGNILWGGPAAAAVLTHGLTQRYVEAP